MIWYNQPLSLVDMPENVEFRLKGYYRKGDEQYYSKDIIQIVITNNSDYEPLICYTHNPSMLTREEPNAEDVLAKYQAKINKITNKYKSFKDIYPKGSGKAFS